MTVNVSLTPESIQNAIKELKAYKKRIETGTDKLLDKMADDALASGSPQTTQRIATKEEIVAMYKALWD